MTQLIECVPNFSEGRDLNIIRQITDAIKSTAGVKLLNVDSGMAANRTVITFAGEPQVIVEAAFAGIKKASELIDMTKHKGEHPRVGATDVCPLIPLANITMEEASAWAVKLAQRVGEALKIPVYLYEESQPDKKRSNLSVIRAGGYEGFIDKIGLPGWKPDFGPCELPPKHGATVMGARDFLIAYNINLNTKSVTLANSIACDIRESGRIKTTSEKEINDNPIRVPAKLKGVKAIGWYIKEYGIAQVSVNITRYRETPLHVVFEECVKSAHERGATVTGSELIGLIPLAALTEAGKYYLKTQRLSTAINERELIEAAVTALGLNELKPFNPQKRIIEYLLEEKSFDFTSLP